MPCNQRVAPLIKPLEVGDAVTPVLLVSGSQNLSVVDAFTGETLVSAKDLRPGFAHNCSLAYHASTHQTHVCAGCDASAVLVVPPTPIGFAGVVAQLCEGVVEAAKEKGAKWQKDSRRSELVVEELRCYLYLKEAKCLLASLEFEEASFLSLDIHQPFLARLYKSRLIEQVRG